MRCNFCNGSGESYDIRLLRIIDCEYCDGSGIIPNHDKDKEYARIVRKRDKKRVPKLGRDYELEEKDE